MEKINNQKPNINNILKRLAIAILPVVAIALLGMIFNRLGMDWYENLNKPTQWIPAVAFPILWTTIYALFIYINFKISSKQDTAIYWILFAINGILNVCWCLIFFTLNLTFVGQLIIILNLIFAFLLIKELNKFDSLYSKILFIYPIWLSFATALNLALWILN